VTKEERFFAKAALTANIILIAGGIASALFFAYVCYRHGWPVQRRLTSWKMALGLVSPALLAGLLFAALRLRREYKVNLVMVCVTLVFAVYAGEVILSLNILKPAPFRQGQPIMTALLKSKDREREAAKLAKEFGVPIDTRDKYEVITDLRSQGVDAVPSVIAIYQLRFYYDRGNISSAVNAPPVLALAGISNKTTVLCNENGQFVTYESDEHGFRNPKGMWHSRPIDIATVGDSFTQGYCVPDGKDFVDIIRQQHAATLNLGMAGEGPVLMLATLKEYAPSVRPRVVIWFFFEGNDFVDLQDEKKSPLVMKYLEHGFSQELLRRQGEIDRVLVDLVEKEKARDIAARERVRRQSEGIVSRTRDVIKLRALRYKLGLLRGTNERDATSASEARDLELFRQVLSQAKATVASWNGVFYFVYLPNWGRFARRADGLFGASLPEERRHDQVIELTRDLEIPTIDLLPVFEAHPDPMSLFPFRAAGHYAESGHRLVADEVLKAVASRVSQTAERGR
jgi:hypothetical protein